MKIRKAVSIVLTAAMLVTSAFPAYAAEFMSYDGMQTKTAGAIEAMETLEITLADGWCEEAYAQWNPVSGAEAYNVYYRQAAETAYTKADAELVRGTRVDIPGLKGKTDYVLKVVPVISGTENEAMAAETQITTMEYTREGYAFSSKSPKGTTTGGYNSDGTVPADAQILYITDDNASTIEHTVMVNGKAYAAKGLTGIMMARQTKAAETTPLILRFIGTINDTAISSGSYTTPDGTVKTADAPNASLMLLDVKSTQNVTLEGIGTDAMFVGWGLNIRDCTNIEVRNLAYKGFPDDSVSLNTDNFNVWIHNNDFMLGKNMGGDKKKGDGSCDVKAGSSFVTVSYNRFHNTGKSSLCGQGDSAEFFVTYHHNWYEKIGSRAPRVRYATVHSYNNYYDHNYAGGTAACMGSNVFVEANYFEDAIRPMMIASQGASIKEDGKDFNSSEAGGTIKAYNNILASCGGTVTYLNGELESITATCKGCTPFTPMVDAYVVESRDEKVPSTWTALKGGAVYNNFDTAADMYEYTPDEPEMARAKAVAYSGRIKEGKVLIPNPEDPILPTTEATTEATTETTTFDPENTETTEETTYAPIESAYVWNYSTGENANGFFTTVGGEKANPPSVTYNGMTLTKALKMDSVGKVSFNAPVSGVLRVVTYTTKVSKMNIDTEKISLTQNAMDVTERSVAPGEHSVTKNGGEFNLYYVEFIPDSTGEITTEPTTSQPITGDDPTEATTSSMQEVNKYDFEKGVAGAEFPKEETSPVDNPTGAYYTLTYKTDGTASDNGTTKVTYENFGGSMKAYVQDKETGAATVNFITPFVKQSGGVIEVSADIMPDTQTNKWTLMQLHGKNASGINSEIIGIRTDSAKYGYRINGADTVTTLEVSNTANVEVNVKITIDIDNGTAAVAIKPAGGAAVTSSQITGLDVSEISFAKFVTAGGARSIYVDNVELKIAGDEPATDEESSETSTETSSETSTEAISETSTQATTETPVEPTSTEVKEVVKYDYADKAEDEEVNKETGDSPYYTVSAESALSKVIYKKFNDKMQVCLSDNDATTLSYIVPFEKQSTGIVEAEAVVTPASEGNKWTFMQLHGVTGVVDGIEQTGEVVGIRPFKFDGKNIIYGIRVNGCADTDMINTGIPLRLNEEIKINISVDFDKSTVVVTMIPSGSQVTALEAYVSEPLDITADKLSALKFVTSGTDSRTLYIDTVSVVTKETVVVDGIQGDVDGDGGVTALDAALVHQYVLNKSVTHLTEAQLKRARCDSDSTEITASNSLRILSKALSQA